LDIKVLNVNDAWCNHEVFLMCLPVFRNQ